MPACHSGDARGRDIGIEAKSETVRPLPGNPARNLAPAISDIGFGSKAGEVERAIFETRRADIGIDAGIALGIAPGGGDGRTVDTDRHGTAERGVAGFQIDGKSDRIIALRAQGQRPVEPSSRQCEVTRNAVLTQRQPATDAGAIDVEPIDRDTGRSGFGQDKAERAVERAEQRTARHVKREALFSRGKRDAHILKSGRGIGVCQHQHRLRAVCRELGIDRERPIIRLPSAARQCGSGAVATRHDLAVQPRLDPLAGDSHVAQHQRLIRPDPQRAGKADFIARQIDDGGIADPVQHPGQVRAQAPRHRRAELGEDLGGRRHLARIINRQLARAYRSGQRIGPGGNVPAQRKGRRKAGKGDPCGIGGKRLALGIIDERSGHLALNKPRIGLRVAGRHARGCQRQGHRKLRPVETGQPFLHQLFRFHSAGFEPSDRKPMIDPEIAECAGDVGGKTGILEAPALAQQIGVAQHHAGARAFDPVIGKIHHPCRSQSKRLRDHRAAPFDHTVIEREAGGERDLRPQRAGQHIFACQLRAQAAQNADHAGFIGDPERRHRRRARICRSFAGQTACHRCAAPALPGAVPRNARGIAGLEPGKAGQHAIGRCAEIGGQIETIAVGLGIEQQGDPVARAQLGLGIKQRAPFADIDAGLKVGLFVARRRHPLGDHQILDRELVHADVEIGQQRRIGIPGKQCGQPLQPPAPRGNLADVEPAPQPA